MSSSKSTPRKQTVSTAKTGRRHRSDDEKLKIVQESFEEGTVQAQLARRHGISTSQLWDWRARYKAGLLGGSAEFSQVVVTQEMTGGAEDQARPADAGPVLVVEVGQHYRLTIPAGFDMDGAVRLLRGLA
ncbi:MAG: transposase [Rhodobacteraceae bacterium]|nr:transposase [Paracoccaceae bacterium]